MEVAISHQIKRYHITRQYVAIKQIGIYLRFIILILKFLIFDIYLLV